MKKIFILFLCFFFTPLIAYANDYTIKNYDVAIKILEDNTLEINEMISVNFTTQKHGIYRNIPLINHVARLDGSTTKTYGKVKNLQVNEPFSTNVTKDFYNIQIGSASKYVTGKKDYMISYTYELRGRTNKDFDEFYFNLIGDGWDTTIDHVNFWVSFPKDFDTSKIGFSKGSYGMTNNDDINYEVNNNTIIGSLNSPLNKNEALTIRVLLDKGYFKIKINLVEVLPFFTILFLIIAFIIWFIYGKDKKEIETVEFYPPDNLNSLDIAYIYKGKTENKDVTSLLLCLANKGYLKISDLEIETQIISKDTYSIDLIKDYDGNDKNEEMFMYGLFKKYNRKSVTASKLYNEFYQTTEDIKKNVKKEKQNLIFEKLSISKAKYVLYLLYLSLFFLIILPIGIEKDYQIAIIVTVLILFYSPFYATIFSPDMHMNIFIRLFSGMFIIFHSIAFLSGFISPLFINYPYYYIGFIIGIICTIGTLIIYKLMPRRTKYGINMLGRIKGFKRYLETAEKEQLEKMVLKDPTYFYKILPYTYVLGISNLWIEKFENINLKEPDWYYSDYPFNQHTFNTFIFNTMDNVNTNMSASYSSGSSGGSSSSSSGGGFSGGGSGGGGGGSW